MVISLPSNTISNMIFTLFAETDPQHNHQIAEFQVVCMLNLLGLKEGEGVTEALTSMGICNKETKLDNPCDWNGVRCTEDILTHIHWTNGFTVQIIDIAWLPSTLMILNMPNADIDSELETRRLSQGLTDCDMTNCGLYGSLELRTLPSELRSLKLTNNEFSGTVKLTDLPKNFWRLDLRLNPLKTVVVRRKDLPEGLSCAKFYNPYKKVKFICTDAKKVDKRVYIAEYESLCSLSSECSYVSESALSFLSSSEGSECAV